MGGWASQHRWYQYHEKYHTYYFTSINIHRTIYTQEIGLTVCKSQFWETNEKAWNVFLANKKTVLEQSKYFSPTRREVLLHPLWTVVHSRLDPNLWIYPQSQIIIATSNTIYMEIYHYGKTEEGVNINLHFATTTRHKNSYSLEVKKQRILR